MLWSAAFDYKGMFTVDRETDFLDVRAWEIAVQIVVVRIFFEVEAWHDLVVKMDLVMYTIAKVIDEVMKGLELMRKGMVCWNV